MIQENKTRRDGSSGEGGNSSTLLFSIYITFSYSLYSKLPLKI